MIPITIFFPNCTVPLFVIIIYHSFILSTRVYRPSAGIKYHHFSIFFFFLVYCMKLPYSLQASPASTHIQNVFDADNAAAVQKKVLDLGLLRTTSRTAHLGGGHPEVIDKKSYIMNGERRSVWRRRHHPFVSVPLLSLCNPSPGVQPPPPQGGRQIVARTERWRR